MQAAKVRLTEHHTVQSNFELDVIQGLSKTPKSIPPKYFYDEKGSKLFEAITKSQDYYPTRTEVEILRSNANEIAEVIKPGCVLIEPGGANFEKVKLLLNELRPNVFIPVDISTQHMLNAAKKLAQEYDWLDIHALGTDFVHNLELPAGLPNHHRVAFFPGSSIGNFHPEDAQKFLATLAKMLDQNGYLLIGIDLKKDHEILVKAYNDSQGYTAQFNLNLLSRINRELSANFDLSAWRHEAIYNADKSRIEMHLFSQQEQTVVISDNEFNFAKDESIHTECSYKYSTEEFHKLAKQAGFINQQTWIDQNQLFSVHLFSVSNV